VSIRGGAAPNVASWPAETMGRGEGTSLGLVEEIEGGQGASRVDVRGGGDAARRSRR
jgi:hypothetical protein